MPTEAKHAAEFEPWQVQNELVYVLHAFGKKTPSTAQTDIELAAKRYAEVAKR